MPSRRRRQRERAAATAVDRRGRPSASWKWLTFPVFCALATGLFLGYNVGLLTRVRPQIEQVATLLFAVLFAFAMSQLATRPVTEMLLRRKTRQQQSGTRPSESQ
jgi:hypothetical protein